MFASGRDNPRTQVPAEERDRRWLFLNPYTTLITLGPASTVPAYLTRLRDRWERRKQKRFPLPQQLVSTINQQQQQAPRKRPSHMQSVNGFQQAESQRHASCLRAKFNGLTSSFLLNLQNAGSDVPLVAGGDHDLLEPLTRDYEVSKALVSAYAESLGKVIVPIKADGHCGVSSVNFSTQRLPYFNTAVPIPEQERVRLDDRLKALVRHTRENVARLALSLVSQAAAADNGANDGGIQAARDWMEAFQQGIPSDNTTDNEGQGARAYASFLDWISDMRRMCEDRAVRLCA